MATCPIEPQVSASRLLQDFELRRVLGAGEFGAVIECRNKLDRKDYAIKITTNVLDTREIQNLGKLPTHENLVQYHTSWKDSISIPQLEDKLGLTSGSQLGTPPGTIPLNVLCVQMELCGQDLRHWLGQVQSVDAQLSIEIFIQLLSGLNHIHTNNLIHRDLKPENIFFDKNNPSLVKIGDLGIATDHSATNSALLHTEGAGTPMYRAPEQCLASYSKSVDIYALGIIFMELLCPELQGGGNFQELFAAVHALKSNKILPDSISSTWPKTAALIIDMVSVDPEKRPDYEAIFATFAAPGPNDPEPQIPAPAATAVHTGISCTTFVPQNLAPTVIHTGITCDGCGAMDITGVRYNCTTCANYDLCEDCEKKDGLHPEDHTLLKMKTSRGPTPNSNLDPVPIATFPSRSPTCSHDNRQKHDSVQNQLLTLLNLNSVGESQTNSDDSLSGKEVAGVYRNGAICNNCDRSVETWFHCDNCPLRFDLCEDCYHQNLFLRHPSRHTFTKFKCVGSPDGDNNS